MRALIEEVVADNRGRKVTLDSPRQAYGQRSRFYALIAAVKRDLTHKPAWMDERAARDLTEFLQRAMTIEMIVDGPCLILRPRDESPIADKLRAAVPLDQADATPSAAVDASIASLLEKINVKK